MRLRSAYFWTKWLAPALAIPIVVLGFRGGPPAGRTGAPGELTCFAAGCHQTASGALIEDSAAIQVNFPDGAAYQPGQAQSLTLMVNDPEGQVFGFQLSARDPSNAQAGTLTPVDATTQVVSAGGIDYIEHTGPRADGTFTFDWTPPGDNVGAITFYVAANAANNDFLPTGDRIHLRSVTAEPAPGDRPAISENGVVHGATFDAADGFAPNTFASVFGINLVQSTEVWDNAFEEGVAPTSLGGVRVLVNGKPGFISFTGRAEDIGQDADQINLLLPDEEMRGDVEVVVEGPDGDSEPAFIQLTDRAPALFAFQPRNRRYAASVQNDGSAFVGPGDLFGDGQLDRPIRPAQPGDLIQLFGSGFGGTMPSVPAGAIPPGAAETVDPVSVRVGESVAEVLFAGLSSFAGVYQIVIEVPQVPAGEHEIVAEIGGDQTQGGLFTIVGSE